MKHIQKIPDFKNDEEISAFMEAHDGFELLDQGLAEIVETPSLPKRRKNSVELNVETLQLLNDLVTAGICVNAEDAVSKAVHSYVVAVLPHSYTLIRGK